ncbi:MAG: hypothetical protein OHK0017_07210 [Patescibacteria group bacterium]
MIKQFELTIKNEINLNKKIEWLIRFGVNSVSITSKKDNLNSFEIVDKIRAKIPEIEFTLNYSIANNYNRNISEVFSKLINFISNCQNYKITRVLLVSGNPQKSIDTLKMLEAVKDMPQDFAVAFNPFINTDEELFRLQQKLKYSNVKSVYFQLGDNLVQISAAVEAVRSLRQDLQIFVSVLNPTPQSLNMLKLRPWNGVKYSREFLSEVETAASVNQSLEKYCENEKLNILYVI